MVAQGGDQTGLKTGETHQPCGLQVVTKQHSQPPKADMGIPITQTNQQVAEAATVQLPEPAACVVGQNTVAWNTTQRPIAGGALYTEQQVHQHSAALEFQLDELAMLTRKLVQSLRKASPGNESAEKALDYLKRKGLAGNPLRAAHEQSNGQQT